MFFNSSSYRMEDFSEMSLDFQILGFPNLPRKKHVLTSKAMNPNLPRPGNKLENCSNLTRKSFRRKMALAYSNTL